jgi:hypothetical protein
MAAFPLPPNGNRVASVGAPKPAVVTKFCDAA